MAVKDYKLGTPLGPDPEAVADLNAIDTYVRTVSRSGVVKYPKSLPLVEDYERWRQTQGYWQLMVFPNDVLKTAKAKRDAINQAQENVLPLDTIVEEGSFITSPEQKKPHPFLWGVGIGLVAAIAAAFGLHHAKRRLTLSS